jgi:hypothetical protein
VKEHKKICGYCKWSKQDVPYSDYVCHNEESDCYALECEFYDGCENYEEKD